MSDTEIEVSPIQGGQLKSKDGKLTLDIPPGAVSEAARITHRVLPKGKDKDLFYVFELKAKKKADGTEFSQFSRALTLTLDLATLDLSGLSRNMAVMFFTQNQTTGRWEEVPTVRDPVRNTIRARLQHFSPWSAGADLVMTQEAFPSVQGFGQVDLFTGNASLNYPLVVPPGPGHFQPSLALSYSSNWINDHAQTGEIGISGYLPEGWSLNGFPQISRDVHGSPANTADDIFNLSAPFGNGRLIKSSDGYWHSADESFVRIWRDLNEYSNWYALDKSGTRYVFSPKTDFFALLDGGNCASGALLPNKWYLTSMTDTNNNSITIEYAPAEQGLLIYNCNGQRSATYNRATHPTAIRYANNRVTLYFWYAPKPYFSCDISRQQPCEDQLLQNIEVRVNDGVDRLVRRYVLGYDGTTPVSITQRGSNDSSTLPAYTFAYGTSANTHLLLTQATNGYGGQVAFAYWQEPVTRVCTDYSCATVGPPYYRWVVTSKTLSSASPASAFSVEYQYENPKIQDNQSDSSSEEMGYKFLGHSLVRELLHSGGLDTAIVNKSESLFYQRLDPEYLIDPRQGKIYESRALDGGGALYQKRTYAYSIYPIYSRSAYPIYNINFNRLDQSDQFIYETTGSPRQTRMTYGYDGYGNVTTEKRWGDITDSSQALRTQREFVVNVAGVDKYIVDKVTLENVYQDNCNCWKTQTQYFYDGNGYAVPPYPGNLTKVEVSDQSNGRLVRTQTSYFLNGNPNVVTDHYGRSTTTTYEGVLNALPYQVTNAKGQVTTYQYTYPLAKLSSVSDPNGAVTGYAYDVFGRVSNVWSPTEQFNVHPSTLKLTYTDGLPFVVKTEQRTDLGGWNAAQYQASVKVYNGLGQLVQTQTPGDANGQLIVTNTRYNSLGKVERNSLPYPVGASLGSFLSVEWNNLNNQASTSTIYDGLARPLDVTASDNTLTRYRYTVGRSAVLDANGHQKISYTDGLGRVTRVNEYDGAYGSSVNWDIAPYATTWYAYDILNNLTSVSDAASNTTWMSYDNLGHKIGMTDVDMGQWWYGYDYLGHLTSQQDANGRTITFGYDELYRLTSKSGPALSVVYRYDEPGHGAGIGQRTSLSDGSGSTSWTYDLRGRVTQETKTINGAGTFNTSTSYDAADRVRTLTYPDGEVVTNGYNDVVVNGVNTTRGLLQSVAGASSYLNSSSYNALAQITQQTYGNGVSTNYNYYDASYNNSYRLRQLLVNSGSLLNLQYSYDNVGNVTSINDGGTVSTFAYDALNRLLSGYGDSYAYNALGNFTSSSSLGNYTYGSKPHAVTSIVGGAWNANLTYSYDANGNMLSRTEFGSTYDQSWDAENRLRQVTLRGTTQSNSFVYDGDGQRVHKGDTRNGIAYLGQLAEIKTGCQPVSWLNAVNVSLYGHTLQKSSGGSDWNAGAASAQSIAAGDGYVEVVVDATNAYRMVGLSNGDSNQSYVDIDFAIYPAADGGLYVYEAGAYRGYFGTYAVGDRLRVSVDKGVVRYYKNNALLYTSGVAPIYPLLVDTSLYTPNGQVAQAILCAPQAVNWINLVNVSANGNTLQKTSGGWDWNAGAASSQALASGDGYVEVVVDATNAYRMFGLSNGDSNAAYWDIDFALYPADGGGLYVYESGTYRGYFGTYAVGDRLRVAVEAGVVRYYRNNALLYTSGTAPTYPLLVDTSLYTPNGQVAQAVVSSGFREWKKYYYFGARRVALRDATGVYWLQGDHLGSTSLTTLSSGAVQMTSRYGAYGLVRSSSGGAVSDYRFTGQRQESLGNNWIYDYGARFYDALIGRFLSADSIVPGAGNPQALNRYAYTFNNPLKYVDPTGHCVEPVTFVLCLGGALVVGGGTLAVGLIVMPDVSPVSGPRITTPRVPIDASVRESGDMTGWLINQMTTNATSSVVASIRENCCTTSPEKTLGAMRAFGLSFA